MNLGYTGKPYDSATGLYNYGYRDYQPEAARFTTIDPVRDGSNWFAYVNNDPVNWVDPWGLFNLYHVAAIGVTITAGLITVATIVEDVVTLGAGTVDDPASAAAVTGLMATAGALWATGNVQDSLRHTPDQEALNGLAKEAKNKGGITPEDAETLVDWGDEVNLPVRGPEIHPGRVYGAEPHIHVGSVDHIPVNNACGK
jgi:RHS repeat-associated protein